MKNCTANPAAMRPLSFCSLRIDIAVQLIQRFTKTKVFGFYHQVLLIERRLIVCYMLRFHLDTQNFNHDTEHSIPHIKRYRDRKSL